MPARHGFAEGESGGGGGTTKAKFYVIYYVSMATPTNASTSTVIDFVDLLQDNAPAVAAPVQAEVSQNSRDLWQGFNSIDWTTPSWDIIILLFFAATIVVYGFTLGRDRIVAVLVSTYLALAVADNFPYVAQLSDAINRSGFTGFKASSFLVIFVLLFILLSRSRLLQSVSSFGGSWWQVILFSLLQVGLLVSIIFSYLPSQTLAHFSPFTQVVFLSDLGRFCWIVLPIAALVFFGGHRRKRRRRGIGNVEDFDY